MRLVVGQRGQVDFRIERVIRFDYGVSVPWGTQLENEMGLQAIAGPDRLVLRTPARLHGEDLRTVGEFSVSAGETIPFVLSHGPSHPPRPNAIDAQLALARTETFWRNWSARCPSVGLWSAAVTRSLLTLKGLTYGPTGGIVAAPTTLLPEQIGGLRNWDYRYCWLRDAAFTLLALMNFGYCDEAGARRDWLLRAVAGSPAQVQLLYGVAGERQAPERELPWLAGYESSRPVRIGDAAAGQHQLDVYGQVIHAMFEAVNGGMPPTQRGADIRRIVLEYVETIWREPDEGIWEVRGGRRHFTHSKVMAWVAFDRAAIIAKKAGDTNTSVRWRRIADAIREEVCRSGFDAELSSFVQFYGSRQLDASLLQIPFVSFLPASDLRMRGTVAAIERRLVREGGLVMRYDTEEAVDGLPPGEGAFLACSFWLADNYVLQRRFDEARALFEQLLALRNDLGLLSEEYDARVGRMLGNFPQAFSHVGLINTAIRLARLDELAGA